MINLFLDDYRWPADVTWVRLPDVKWVIVRSYEEAVMWVEDNGFPDMVSFDHDLADAHYLGTPSDEKTGYDFAKWLVNRDMDLHDMPDNFTFFVHSMNPIGARNIKEYLQLYMLRRGK